MTIIIVRITDKSFNNDDDDNDNNNNNINDDNNNKNNNDNNNNIKILILVNIFFTSCLNLIKLMFLFIELGNLFQTEDGLIYERLFCPMVVYEKEP